ncbi:MAG: hypothetical protein LBB26_02880 [Puniceicoccales bacterium]|jgi:hypothetical protein|nr:hypothetical protein [Puniceicoccales bacterium]
MKYKNGKIYEIVTPLYGALLFKYTGTGTGGTFSSVDRNGNSLNVCIYQMSNGVIQAPKRDWPYVIMASDLPAKNYSIGLVDDWKILKSFTSPTIGEGIALNVDPMSDRYASSIVQALTEDSAALVLYTCVQAMMPYMVTMANATKCFSSSQISFDMISMRHSQSVLQKQTAMEKMMEEIRNSKLMKFLSSPWFIVLLVVAAVLIALACIFTAGALAVVIVAAITVALVATAVTLISVYYVEDKEKLEETKKNLGYTDGVVMPEELQEMYDKAQEALTTAFWVAFAMIIVSTVSMIWSGGTITTAISQMAQRLANLAAHGVVSEAIKRVATVLVIVGIAGSIASATTAVASGIYSIVEGLLMKGMAAVEHAISKLRAQVDALSGMSKFFKELMSRMEQSLKMLMETLQELIKGQGEIIKTLGEGSRTVTRNIAGI